MRREGPTPWRKWGCDILFIALTSAVGTAFFVARSWLPELTTQEGNKLAITLVNKDVLALDNKILSDKTCRMSSQNFSA